MLSMSGLWVLFLLIFISAIPAIAAYCWFRIIRYPLSLVRFLISLLAGAAAFFPALFFQHFFPSAVFPAAGRWALLIQIFVRIALTEELSRLLVLLVFFRVSRRLENRRAGFSSAPAGEAVPLSYSAVSQGAAVGLAAGLGFAVVESAAYGASNAGILLLRSVTAAPLHGACGSRIGAAAVMLQGSPSQALFRVFSAAAIHGIYNFMIVMPGFPAIAAVLIALSALASSIVSIRKGPAEQTPG
jgi:RsiW-degrading membrane proteinase PrsW (M82 family)